MKSFLIHANNYVDIVHDACRLCYKSKGRDTLEGKLKYIENKVKIGHESILEHSNIITLLILNKDMYKDLSEVQAAGPNLNYSIKEVHEKVFVVIGGSIRAYKNIYRNIKNGNNGVLNLITQTLYETPKEFYYDFIEAGIMNARSFIDPVSIQAYNSTYYRDKENKYYDIVNIDNIVRTSNLIHDITGAKVFEYDDLLDMHTASVYVKRMSRITSQQLTRHRNAISQKSQRYVDEEDAIFIHPYEFTTLFSKDGKSNLMDNFDCDEVCENQIKIYKDMRQENINKEDARYYLPQNANTELYVTFTLRNLLHFIYLRKEPDAQAEIRNFAILLYEDIKSIMGDVLDDDMSIYLLPKYILSENNYSLDNAFNEADETELEI